MFNCLSLRVLGAILVNTLGVVLLVANPDDLFTAKGVLGICALGVALAIAYTAGRAYEEDKA